MKFSKLANIVAFTAIGTKAQGFNPELMKRLVRDPPIDGKFFYLDMNSPKQVIDLHVGSELQELNVVLNT